jgi:hypothetical protein
MSLDSSCILCGGFSPLVVIVSLVSSYVLLGVVLYH